MGNTIVFQSSSSSRIDIWALRERTGLFRKGRGEPLQLTAGPMVFRSPVSSVDGKRLFMIGEQTRGELMRFESKSGQFVPSPDGRYVLGCARFSETDLCRLQYSRVGGIGKQSCGFSELVPRRKLHLL